jgi:asparagine synthetase B (glutamine-hydrolysing)
MNFKTPKIKIMSTKNLTSTSDYLLPESLAGLHQESSEWLETVAFWKDETRFFATLLKGPGIASPNEKDQAEMLRNLDRLHEMLFEYLADEIREHEHLLSQIEKGAQGIADARYREAHRSLKEKMAKFTLDFRKFKSLVFSYAKDWKSFRPS